ncbi:MAG: DegT/DnrJ/EryC1/StrS family aminotransferase [bacterium]
MRSKPAIEGGKPVRDEFLVYGSPHIGEEEINEVAETLRCGWVGLGPRTRKFEEEFAGYTGSKHAIGLNSCTAGLFLSLKVAGLEKGDEVVTSPMTFCSTANVIEHCGARPVFVDINRETLNMNPSKLEEAIGEKTKAMIPVHMAGRPCDMDSILKIAEGNRLVVINDAAHAIETRYKGKSIGCLGDFSSFSFYATKTLAIGEGGMLTTDNDGWAQRIRILRLHGISKDAWRRYTSEGYARYETVEPGYKFNMWDVQAAIGIHQLKRIDQNLVRRKELSRRYDEAFRELEQLMVMDTEDREGIRHARCIYIVLLRLESLKIDRDGFIAALKAENIGTGIHFISLHTHQYYRDKYNFSPGQFPEARFVSERTLSLPLSAKVTDREADDVIEAVRKIARYYAR